MLNSKGSVGQAQVYTDLSGLTKLGAAAQKNDPKAIAQVAQQFESLFMNLMLKSMRDANAVFAEGNMLNSENISTYQQMLDQQLSVSLSGRGSMGLAKILMKQLSPAGQMAVVQHQQQDSALNKGMAAMLHNPLAKDETALLKTLGQHADLRPQTQRGVLLDDIEQSSGEAGTLGAASTYENDLDCAMYPEFDNAGIALLSQNFTLNNSPSSATVMQPTVSPFEKKPALTGVSAPASARQQDFIRALMPKAQAVSARSGLDAKILIAQAALETGWGKHIIKHPNGSSSYNLFNIKADDNWAGKTVTKDVTEYRDGVMFKQRARFRAYDSFTESFQDYLHLVQNSDRYAKAMLYRNEPQDYIRQLHRAGYATDPLYSAKVNQVYQQVIATEGT